jgi:hypothetical protein
VVEAADKREKYILTAAHGLPKIAGRDLPPAHPFRYAHECTYKNILAPLGRKPEVKMRALQTELATDARCPDKQDVQ